MSSFGCCSANYDITHNPQQTINAAMQNHIAHENNQNWEVAIDDFDNGIVAIVGDGAVNLGNDFLKYHFVDIIMGLIHSNPEFDRKFTKAERDEFQINHIVFADSIKLPIIGQDSTLECTAEKQIENLKITFPKKFISNLLNSSDEKYKNNIKNWIKNLAKTVNIIIADGTQSDAINFFQWLSDETVENRYAFRFQSKDEHIQVTCDCVCDIRDVAKGIVSISELKTIDVNDNFVDILTETLKSNPEWEEYFKRTTKKDVDTKSVKAQFNIKRIIFQDSLECFHFPDEIDLKDIADKQIANFQITLPKKVVFDILISENEEYKNNIKIWIKNLAKKINITIRDGTKLDAIKLFEFLSDELSDEKSDKKNTITYTDKTNQKHTLYTECISNNKSIIVRSNPTLDRYTEMISTRHFTSFSDLLKFELSSRNKFGINEKLHYNPFHFIGNKYFNPSDNANWDKNGQLKSALKEKIVEDKDVIALLDLYFPKLQTIHLYTEKDFEFFWKHLDDIKALNKKREKENRKPIIGFNFYFYTETINHSVYYKEWENKTYKNSDYIDALLLKKEKEYNESDFLISSFVEKSNVFESGFLLTSSVYAVDSYGWRLHDSNRTICVKDYGYRIVTENNGDVVLIFDDNIVAIYGARFRGNNKITKVIGKNVVFIDHETFAYCTSLKSVEFPAAKKFGYMAFAYCTSLESVYAQVLEECDYRVFFGCTLLKSVYAPALQKLGQEVFNRCKSLTTVTLSPNAINKKAMINEIFIGSNPNVKIQVAKESDKNANN